MQDLYRDLKIKCTTSSDTLHSLCQSEIFAAQSEINISPINIISPLAITDNSRSIVSPECDEASSTDISDFDEYNDEDSDEPFLEFLFKLDHVNEETVFVENGYRKLDKICNTLQGELYKAQQISNNQYVAIKKTVKSQFKQRVAVQNGFSFCITENRIKEASILQYLTVDNMPIGDYIIKYIDSFETDTDYYLVMEYIESQINLKQFVEISHQYISNGKLKLKQYHETIKYLYWQLVLVIHWLHNDMKCCHLDLCMENIMLKNCNFMEVGHEKLMINPEISIKLGDFGVSELFKTDFSSKNLKSLNPFCCLKQNLSLDNESYLAPKICKDEVYDARLADIWSIGNLLFQCMTGKPLYEPIEVWQPTDIHDGYWALTHGKLKEHLLINGNLKYFTTDSFGLLINLLNINENERYNVTDILSHKWFHLYYKRYCKQIEKKSMFQSHKFVENKVKIRYFPFYKQ